MSNPYFAAISFNCFNFVKNCVMKDRLAKFMKNEGLSPSRFAEILGVPPSSISHLLAGRNKPSFDFLAKMTQRFPRLNPDWLLLGTGPIYRPTAGATMPAEMATPPVATSTSENRTESFAPAIPREEATYEALGERTTQDMFGASHEEIEEQTEEDFPQEKRFFSEESDSSKAAFPVPPVSMPATPKPEDARKSRDPQGIARIIICYTDGTFEILTPNT